jgi:hypothetical protein
VPILGQPLGNVNIPNINVDTVPTISPNVPAGTELDPATQNNQDIVVDPNVAVDVDAASQSPGPLVNLEPVPGFVSGILHGLISPFMLVLGLFMPGVRMYALNNIGARYDLGFLIGFILLLALTAAPRYYYRRYRGRGYRG